jgi:hypothetical protein
MLSGQRSDEDKSEEDKSEAEGEDSNSEDEISAASDDKMLRRVSTAEVRLDRRIHDDPLKFAQMKGDLLFARPSCFRDSVGFLYLVDMLGAARGHRPFLSRVDQREDDWGDYSALVLAVLRLAPPLPDDWWDSLVTVADFGDSILVATRTGEAPPPPSPLFLSMRRKFGAPCARLRIYAYLAYPTHLRICVGYNTQQMRSLRIHLRILTLYVATHLFACVPYASTHMRRYNTQQMRSLRRHLRILTLYVATHLFAYQNRTYKNA